MEKKTKWFEVQKHLFPRRSRYVTYFLQRGIGTTNMYKLLLIELINVLCMIRKIPNNIFYSIQSPC